MKAITVTSLLAILISLSGCQVVGGIFKAGIWVGVLAVGAVVALIVFLISRGGGK